MQELNKEFILALIEDGIERHGTQAAYERAVGLNKQAIKDIKRSKKCPPADIWLKIAKEAEKSGIELDGQSKPKQNGLTETEQGMISAIQAVIVILSNYDIIRQNDLKNVFSYQQKDFRMRAQPGAALVMDQLIEFLNEQAPPEKLQNTHKPSPLALDQSKNE